MSRLVPSLSVDALRKQIKSGKLAPIYVIVGEDTKLVDALVDGIEATIDPADRAFSVDRVYATEGGGAPVDIIASARTPSMLGGRAIVLRAERFFAEARRQEGRSDDAETDGCEERPDGAWTLRRRLLASPLDDHAAFVAPTWTLAPHVEEAAELAQFVECHGLEINSAATGARRSHRALDDPERCCRWGALEPAGLAVAIDGPDTQAGVRRDRAAAAAPATRRRSPRTHAVAASTRSWTTGRDQRDRRYAEAARATVAFERGDSPHGSSATALVGFVPLVVAEPPRAAGARALMRTDLALKAPAVLLSAGWSTNGKALAYGLA